MTELHLVNSIYIAIQRVVFQGPFQRDRCVTLSSGKTNFYLVYHYTRVMATRECLFPTASVGNGEQHHVSTLVYKPGLWETVAASWHS